MIEFCTILTNFINFFGFLFKIEQMLFAIWMFEKELLLQTLNIPLWRFLARRQMDLAKSFESLSYYLSNEATGDKESTVTISGFEEK